MFTRYFPLFCYIFITNVFISISQKNRCMKMRMLNLKGIHFIVYSRSYKNSEFNGCLACMSNKIQQISCFGMIFSISVLNFLRKTNSIQSIWVCIRYMYNNQIRKCLINVALCFIGPTFESSNKRSMYCFMGKIFIGSTLA